MIKTSYKRMKGAPSYIAWVLLACACGTNDTVEADINSVGAAIIDGTHSGYESVVKVRNGSGLCTGTVLRNDVVLTARHCIETAVGNLEQLEVRSPNGQDRSIRELEIHPDMQGEDMDVALLRLAAPLPVDGRSVGHFQLLHRTDSSALLNQEVHCVGYGMSSCEGGAGTQREGNSIVSHVGPWRDLTVTPGPGGQVPYKGDSGGSCFTDAGRVTHVNRTASCEAFARGVRAEAMGPWVDRVLASWSHFIFDGSGAVLQIAALD